MTSTSSGCSPRPALVGGKSIWVSEQCVRRHRTRRRSCREPWQRAAAAASAVGDRSLSALTRRRGCPPTSPPSTATSSSRTAESWSGSCAEPGRRRARFAPSPGSSAPAWTGTCCRKTPRRAWRDPRRAERALRRALPGAHRPRRNRHGGTGRACGHRAEPGGCCRSCRRGVKSTAAAGFPPTG